MATASVDYREFFCHHSEVEANDASHRWDILGQQIVGSLAECATTALSQGITAFTANLNPMARASAGVSMFNDLIHPKSGGQGSGSNTTNGPTPAPPPPVKDPRPPYSQDPAYSSVQKDMPYLNTLHVLLTTGPGGGVNWDEASGSSDVGAASQSVSYVSSMLQDAKSTFSGLATKDTPSLDFNDILSACVDIANAIETEAKKGTKMSNAFPAADSSAVKDWQSRFQAQYVKAQTMVSVAKSLPGSAAGGVSSHPRRPQDIDHGC
jgi:hypothetical protein